MAIVLFWETYDFYGVGGFVIVEYEINTVVINDLNSVLVLIEMKHKALFILRQRKRIIQTCKGSGSNRTCWIIKLVQLLWVFKHSVILYIKQFWLAVELEVSHGNEVGVDHFRDLVVT